LIWKPWSRCLRWPWDLDDETAGARLADAQRTQGEKRRFLRRLPVRGRTGAIGGKGIGCTFNEQAEDSGCADPRLLGGEVAAGNRGPHGGFEFADERAAAVEA